MSTCICGEINARNCPVHQGETKPREFWMKHLPRQMRDDLGDWCVCDSKCKCDGDKNNPIVHVIEYSALEKAQKEIESLKFWLKDTEEKLAAQAVKLRKAKQIIELILYAQLGGHLNPNKDGKAVLDKASNTLQEIE